MAVAEAVPYSIFPRVKFSSFQRSFKSWDFAPTAKFTTEGYPTKMATVPSPAELQYQLDHPDDNLSPNLIISHAVCLALACVAICLRFTSRHIAEIKYEADDWLMMPALVRYAHELM